MGPMAQTLQQPSFLMHYKKGQRAVPSLRAIQQLNLGLWWRRLLAGGRGLGGGGEGTWRLDASECSGLALIPEHRF